VSRRSREHTRQLATYRSLPVGIIEVARDDSVLLANDRAEEILGVELPKIKREKQNLNFGRDLIDDIIIPAAARSSTDDLGEHTSSDELGERTPYSEISNIRARDQSSRYFAKVRIPRGHRWIQVTATPVLDPSTGARHASNDSRSPETFGVIVPVSTDM